MKNISPFKVSSIAFIKKRLAELHLSISQAERKVGLSKYSIQKMLLGHATDYEKYLAVMKFLRYSVPLYGKLIAGVGVENLLESKNITQVQLPEIIEYSPDLLAILVDDNRYEPRYFKGTYLYFRQNSIAEPTNLHSMHPYIVKIKDSIVDVMIIREGGRLGCFTLVAIDGSAKIITDAELEWCAPIEGAKWEYI